VKQAANAVALKRRGDSSNMSRGGGGGGRGKGKGKSRRNSALDAMEGAPTPEAIQETWALAALFNPSRGILAAPEDAQGREILPLSCDRMPMQTSETPRPPKKKGRPASSKVKREKKIRRMDLDIPLSVPPPRASSARPSHGPLTVSLAPISTRPVPRPRDIPVSAPPINRHRGDERERERETERQIAVESAPETPGVGPEAAEPELYCYCQQPDNGEVMTGCDYEDKCKFGEWFHNACLYLSCIG
ncbi:hypothetical protein KIPB_009648, partial [Kipferlia bialata]